MKRRLVAKRYGKAIFELALESGKPDRVRDELWRLRDAAVEVPTFMRGLSDERVRRERRLDAACAIATALKLGDVVRNAFLLLVKKGDVELLPDIVADVDKRLMVHSHLACAKAMVARKGEAKRIREGIERILGDVLKLDVSCQMCVDPDLLGGFVVHIGDVRFDASVRGRFERMKDELTARACGYGTA